MECKKCGTCCIALDISTLGKPMGVPCKYLGKDLLCSIHETRPDVCRKYTPWEICDLVEGMELDDRVKKMMSIFLD